MRFLSPPIACALALAAGAITGLATASRPVGAEGAASSRTSVLLVTIDTLRVDRVGAYGGRAGLTPVVDQAARDGVLFEHAAAAVPLTRPSHVSLLTGKQPFQHGIRDNFSFALAPEHRTLAEVLKDRGYATGGFVGAFMLNAQSGLNRGFDVFDDQFEQSGGGSVMLAEHQRRAAEVERRAGGWIEKIAAERRPFFAWVHFYDPHSPYDPPPPYAARYAGRPYDGEVAYADAMLGRLLARIDRLGLRDRTLVVITSDHGEGLGDHGEAEHGFFLYETTLHVPLIVRLPGSLPAGVRVSGVVGSTDVLPTILDLAGERAATPAGLPGRSVAPAMRLKAPAAAEVPSYAETLFPRLHFDCAELRSIRAGRWKYIEAPRPELYDLGVDPGERANLYAREGQRARAMRSRLLDTLDGSPESTVLGAASPQLDADTLRRLASLGYVTGSAGSGGRADPKDMVRAFQEYSRSVRGAFEAYDRGDLSAAVAGFESAIAAGRADFDVYFYLGSAQLRLGRAEKAVGPLREAVGRHPAYTPSSIELARALVALGRPGEAMTVLREALARDPRSFQVQSHLGYIARLQRDLPAARQHYEAARALEPRDFDVRMNLSSIYRDAGEASSALAEVDEALRVRPGSGDAHNQRGLLLGGSGRYAEAAAAFERATGLDPQNARFWFNLGLARFRGGNRNAAAEALRRALAIRPDFAEARDLLGEIGRQ